MRLQTKRSAGTLNAKTVFSKYGIYVILVLLIIMCSFISENFFTLSNLFNISRQISVTTIIALCEMILLICGGINLAAGSQLCMSGIVGIYVYLACGNLPIAVVAAVLWGALLGVVNGVITCYLDVPAFITTLATNMAFRGAINVFTGGQTISNLGGFNLLGQGYIWIIPIPVVIMVAMVVLIAFITQKTILGRRLLAIGGNLNAAAASGVNVRLFTFYAFIISGALAGLAGAVLLSRLNMGIPTAGEGYEMDAVAGAVIGGTSMSGGAGSALGVLVGSLIIGIINNILNLTNVMSYVQDIVKGAIIVLAVLLDIQTKNKLK